MKKNKGCQNEDCKAYKKKDYFKSDTKNCPICGEELVYVCRKCYKPLDDDSETLCRMCYAKREQKKETAGNIGKKALGVAGTVAALFLAFNKDEVENQVDDFFGKFNNK